MAGMYNPPKLPPMGPRWCLTDKSDMQVIRSSVKDCLRVGCQDPSVHWCLATYFSFNFKDRMTPTLAMVVGVEEGTTIFLWPANGGA